MATTHPISITIGATLASSLGASVRGAEAQLGRLGQSMKALDARSSSMNRLADLRKQAVEAGKAWQESHAKVAALQSKKSTGEYSTKGLEAAHQRVAALEAKLAGSAGISASKRLRVEQSLATARERLAAQQAKAEDRFSRELEQTAAQAAKAKEKLTRARTAVAELSAELSRAGVNTRSLNTEQTRLGSTLAMLERRTEALTRARAAEQANQDRRNQYLGSMMSTAAVGGAIYGLIQPAVAFESVMADVKKVINFDTPEQFKDISKDLLLLSTRIPMAGDGLGAIMAAAGQSGIAREELLRFTEDAAKMGVAFDLSGSQAGAAMTGLRSIFNLTQDNVVDLGDAINHLSNSMDAKARDLLDVSQRAGSTAKLFGLSGVQLNALGAAFVALKSSPEIAATGINAMLLKLATADKQTEKFQQGLQAIGLSATGLKRMIANDAQGALMTFLQHVKEAPDIMGTLSDLFGLEYADDISKLVGSLDVYQNAIDLVSRQAAYAGSMHKEFASRSATTGNNLVLLRNQANRLGITIGSVLLPPLNAMTGSLRAPLNSIAELAERFPVATQVIFGTIGSVVVLSLATYALGFAWTVLKAPFLRMNTIFASIRAEQALLAASNAATGASTTLLGQKWAALKGSMVGMVGTIRNAAMAFWAMLPAVGATTTALLASPITWIVIGIGAAVAGAALLIRKYWDPMAAYLGGVWEGIQEGLGPALTTIGEALAPLAPVGQAIAAAFGVFANAVGAVVGWIGSLLEPVTVAKDQFEALSASGRSLGQVIGSVLGTALMVITMPIQAVGQVVGWLQERFFALASWQPLESFQIAWQPVAGFFTSLWDGIMAKIGAAMDWIAAKVGWAADIGKKVGSWFSEDDEPTVTSAPGAPIGSALSFSGSMPASATPQPVANHQASNTNISAPININAPGMDAREVAALIDARVRELMRDSQRNNSAALYD